MEASILLKEKWRVQKELAKSSGYDLVKYAALIDSILNEVVNKYKKKKSATYKTSQGATIAAEPKEKYRKK